MQQFKMLYVIFVPLVAPNRIAADFSNCIFCTLYLEKYNFVLFCTCMRLQILPIKFSWLSSPVRCYLRCTAWAYRRISSPFLIASTVLWCAVGFWRPFWWKQRSCHPSASLCCAAYACSASSRSPGACQIHMHHDPCWTWVLTLTFLFKVLELSQ